MSGFERGIAEIFTALEQWLVSTGATQSMLRLSWAVLTCLWLSHIAVSLRPDRPPDVVGAFSRLIVAGGLLSGVGSINQLILLTFTTFRDAGTAVLSGLISQHWNQFVQDWLSPQAATLFQTLGPWFTYPWALTVLLAGVLLGVLLFAVGFMVYLAILFFAHLTLLLAIFLAPLAFALLAAPATARWTARWAVVVVKTGLVVFSVRVIHAAAIYLAVIVPIHQLSAGLSNGFGQTGGSSRGDPSTLGIALLNLVWLLALMLVGTGIGVYAMLRAERLTGQFVEGVAFGEGLFAGPMRLQGQLAGWVSHQAADRQIPDTATIGPPAGGTGPWGPPSGSAQGATVIQPGGRFVR
ncbi:MAG TPA: hypothetical protein VKV57_11790 [bacterium]|nr:hypothetical protein [bacterium]